MVCKKIFVLIKLTLLYHFLSLLKSTNHQNITNTGLAAIKSNYMFLFFFLATTK